MHFSKVWSCTAAHQRSVTMRKGYSFLKKIIIITVFSLSRFIIVALLLFHYFNDVTISINIILLTAPPPPPQGYWNIKRGKGTPQTKNVLIMTTPRPLGKRARISTYNMYSVILISFIISKSIDAFNDKRITLYI